MTQQIAVRIPDDMLAKLDEYVGLRKFSNRTAAVRAAIAALIDQEEERQIAEEYRRGYEKQPLTPAEEADLEAFARASAETMDPW